MPCALVSSQSQCKGYNMLTRACIKHGPLLRQLISPIMPRVMIFQHGDPDITTNLVNSSLSNCRDILQIASKYAYILLSNGRVSDWAVSMVIWIVTKCNYVTFITSELSLRLHCKQLINFLSNVANRQTDRKQTNKQTNQHYRKHTHLDDSSTHMPGNLERVLRHAHKPLLHCILIHQCINLCKRDSNHRVWQGGSSFVSHSTRSFYPHQIVQYGSESENGKE